MSLRMLILTALMTTHLSVGALADCSAPRIDMPEGQARRSFWSRELAFLAYPGSFLWIQSGPPWEGTTEDSDPDRKTPAHLAGVHDRTFTTSPPDKVLAYYQARFPNARSWTDAFGRHILTLEHGWVEDGPIPLGSWSLTVEIGSRQFKQGKLTAVEIAVEAGLDPVPGKNQSASKAVMSTLSQLKRQQPTAASAPKSASARP